MKNQPNNKLENEKIKCVPIPDETAYLSMMESDQKYHLLMELSDDGIAIVQNGMIKESNYCLAKICGYSLEEVVDTCFASFFHSDHIAAVESLCEDSLKDPNAVKTLQATLVCKNGHPFEVEITSALCTFRQRPANMLVIRKIPERLIAGEDLKNHRYHDSVAAISGGIAHDYNNLLTAIIGNISLAQTYLDQADKPFRLLRQALAASQTACNLTQKLITFSRGASPNTEAATVERLVKSAVDFTLSGSNLKCTYTFAPDLWQIHVDQSQISQALHNVVMNAREAMPEGGHIIAAAANVKLMREIPALPAGTYVRISITDQGSGIAEEEFDKIFAPYYSTKNKGGQKATGLGLSICHSIIKKHGGEVTVSSQVGLGTTLNIFLPAVSTHISAKTPVSEPASDRAIFGQGRILVMDDERMIRELAGEILHHLGYRVEFAYEGAEAVACYAAALNSADPFDAVILDLTVRGGMGGKEAIKKLKAIDPNVKGIVSSGYSDDPGMIAFKEYGFCGVVAKPYSLEELGEKLSGALLGRA